MVGPRRRRCSAAIRRAQRRPAPARRAHARAHARPAHPPPRRAARRARSRSSAPSSRRSWRRLFRDARQDRGARHPRHPRGRASSATTITLHDARAASSSRAPSPISRERPADAVRDRVPARAALAGRRAAHALSRGAARLIAPPGALLRRSPRACRAGGRAAAPTSCASARSRSPRATSLAEIAAQVIEQAGEARVERRLGLGGTGITYRALESRRHRPLSRVHGHARPRDPQGPVARHASTAIRARLAARGLTVERSARLRQHLRARRARRARPTRLGLRTIGDLARHPELTRGLQLGLPRARGRLARAAPALRPRPRARARDGARARVSGARQRRGRRHRRLLDRRTARAAAAPAARGRPALLPGLLGRAARAARLRRALSAHVGAPAASAGGPDRRPAHGAPQRAWPISTAERSPRSPRRSSATASRDATAGRGTARASSRALTARAPAARGRVARSRPSLVGVPLGHRSPRACRRLGQVELVAVGMLQTIPALALLVFMIPLFGIGKAPGAGRAVPLRAAADRAQHLRGPHRASTASSWRSPSCSGWARWRRLRAIELPLASISIMAGIKTAAVMTVGTATLAAFIGGGGYGTPDRARPRARRHRRRSWPAPSPAAAMALASTALSSCSTAWRSRAAFASNLGGGCAPASEALPAASCAGRVGGGLGGLLRGQRLRAGRRASGGRALPGAR